MSDGRTHYEGCWRDPGHHACAVAEIERLRAQRDELLAIAKLYASECRLCGGRGTRRRVDWDGMLSDCVSCERCADVRLAIARAEGRSDE